MVCRYAARASPALGATDAVGKIIPGGHFSADEAPEALAEALREFGKTCRS
jgi:pimeloyl-ACP methyl ester carboxylesterase